MNENKQYKVPIPLLTIRRNKNLSNLIDLDNLDSLGSRNEKKSYIQDKVLNLWIKDNYRGTFILSVGLGKSRLIALALQEWYNNMVSKYGEDFNKHVIIGVNSTYLRDEGLPKELAEWKVESKILDKVSIHCYQSLSKDTFFTKLKKKQKVDKKDIDLVISDEADYALTDKYSSIYSNIGDVKYLNVTGTITESGLDIINQLQFYPEIKGVFSVNDAQKYGIINNVKIIIHQLELNKEKNIKVEYKDKSTGKTKHFYTSENDQYDYINREINKLRGAIFAVREEINRTPLERKGPLFGKLKNLNFLKKLKESGRGDNVTSRANMLYSSDTITSYVKELKDKILEDTSNKVIVFAINTKDIDNLTPNGFHGKTDKDRDVVEEFNTDKIREIGVCEKANRGISFENLNNAVVHSFNSSVTKYIQGLIGRMTRLKPKIDSEGKEVQSTAYTHIVYTTYVDNTGKTRACRNFTWLSNLIEERNSEDIIKVKSIEEALQIINK